MLDVVADSPGKVCPHLKKILNKITYDRPGRENSPKLSVDHMQRSSISGTSWKSYL